MTATGVLFRVLNVMLMIGIPVLAAFFLARRGKGGFRPIWIGALAFVLSQAGHLPFNRFLLLPGLRSAGVDLAASGGWSLIILGLAVGLSAGVFEEAARYLVFRYWLPWRGGRLLPVKYGIGHGGVEALLTGLLVLFALVQVLVLGSGAPLQAFSPEEAQIIQSQLEAYWAVPWGQALLGAWERVSALLFHLGASLLVFKGVREKKLGWVAAAVLGHTALNAVAVIGVKTMDLYLLEGVLFLFALCWAAWAWLLRVQDQPVQEPASSPPLKIEKSTAPVPPERLEESRYE